MRNAMRRTLEDVAPDVEDALRAFAPVGPDRGGRRRDEPHLKDSIEAHRTGQLEYVFRAPDHVEFVLEGTRPHEIRGHPLAFEWHGEQAFFTRVRHPGTSPNDFVTPALDAERPHVGSAASRAADVTRRNNGD